MRARNQTKVVLVIEALDDIRAKQEPGSSRRQAPAVNLVWIGPQKVAHGAFVGHFLLAVQQADFVDAVDERG